MTVGAASGTGRAGPGLPAPEAFRRELDARGWVTFPRVVEEGLVECLRADLARGYDVCRAMQVRNGLAANTDGTVHHAVVLGGSFLELLERLPVLPHLREYFGGNFILNSFGGVLNIKDRPSYVSVPHRDIRTFSGDLPLMMNMMVLLDDFTLENGATYLLTGSHRSADAPSSEEEFFRAADRLVAPGGSIVLFNSNLWHAAGANQTDGPRRVLTLTFTKPYLKQQLDYPRALGHEGETFSEALRQVLGYNARVPASLDEWYQPPERRMYKPEQG